MKKIISSGNSELDGKMGGGLPVGSLTLIEGESGAGKSILTQQIIFGSLQDGFKVTLFTSENTVKSLISQMQSLDLDVLDFLLLGKLRVYPMELSGLGQQAPDILLKALRNCGKCQRVIIVDSLTSAGDERGSGPSGALAVRRPPAITGGAGRPAADQDAGGEQGARGDERHRGNRQLRRRAGLGDARHPGEQGEGISDGNECAAIPLRWAAQRL
ncbi:MAG: ATPase domain-containing protein [Chloroflexota bacterium]